MSIDPLLFLVGASRSGTTLLRSMLDSHPEIGVPKEEKSLIPLVGVWSARVPDGGLLEADDARKVDLRRIAKEWKLPEEDVVGAVGADPVEVSEALRRLVSVYAAAQGKSRFAYKMPAYGRHMLVLAKLFPDTPFIHLVRDGRDVASALVEIDFGPATYDEAAFEWKRTVESARSAGNELSSRRYREVHFEQLVSDPGSTLKEICEFVSFDYQPSMLTYFERTDETVVPEYAYRHRGLFIPPTPSLRDFRVDLSARDLRDVELVAGSLLRDLGYEISPRSGLANDLRKAMLLGRSQAKRVGRAARRVLKGERARWPYTGMPSAPRESNPR
jgi:hypothetical protein